MPTTAERKKVLMQELLLLREELEEIKRIKAQGVTGEPLPTEVEGEMPVVSKPGFDRFAPAGVELRTTPPPLIQEGFPALGREVLGGAKTTLSTLRGLTGIGGVQPKPQPTYVSPMETQIAEAATTRRPIPPAEESAKMFVAEPEEGAMFKPHLKEPAPEPIFTKEWEQYKKAVEPKAGEDIGTQVVKFFAGIPAFAGDITDSATKLAIDADVEGAKEIWRMVGEPLGQFGSDLLNAAGYSVAPYKSEEMDKRYKESLERLKQSWPMSFIVANIGKAGVRKLGMAKAAAEGWLGAKKLPTGKVKPVEVMDIVAEKSTKGYGFEKAEMHAGVTPQNVIESTKEVARLTSKMVEGMKAKPEIRAGVKQAKEAMIAHDEQIRTGEFIHRKMRNTFDRAVSDKNAQLDIIHAVQQKRNPKYYNQLTAQEKGVVKWMELELDKLEAFNRKYKITDIKEMPPGVRYVPGSWLNPKTGKPYPMMYGKFSKGLPQAKQKVFSTYEQGMATGAKMATTNLGDIIGGAWESLVRAKESRGMFETLHNIGAEKGIEIRLMPGKPFKPIRMIERWDQLTKQGLTEDYVRYSHPSLDKAITFKDVNGTLTRLQGAVGVHKNLYPFVRSYMESPNYGTFSKLNFATKSLKLGLSLFHVMSLGMQEAANFRVPFKNIPSGLRKIQELGPEMQLLHKVGLDIFKGYEDVGYRNKFFEGSGKWSKMGNTVTKPIEMMRTFIFDVVQPGMKGSFAFDKLNELGPKYLKKGLTEKQAARDVVKIADGHFSGEHYKRSLLETNRFMVKAYFTPEARRFWQGFLLSPTWQREHLLVAKNVAKSFLSDKAIKKLGLAEMGPIKGELRKYALGAIMLIGAVDQWNYQSSLAMDGKGLHLWENPEGKFFSVRAPWNEPGYTIEDKDGKERRVKGGPAYIRPLKSVFEVAEWAKTPVKKFIWKLSPGVTAMGRQFWPSKYQREYKGWPDMDNRLKDFILDVGTPIAASQMGRWAVGKKTLASAIIPFFGAPTSRLPQKQTREMWYGKLAEIQAKHGTSSKEWRRVKDEFESMGYKFSDKVYQIYKKREKK